jgi:rare lipoprotein A
LTKKFYRKAIKVEITLIIVLLAGIVLIASRSAKRRNASKQKAQASTEITQNDDLQSNNEQYSQTETGFASYYNDTFHGDPTASGELYDKNGLTAAHREYPFGTLVRVTNLDNGKSVVVRINDRGPHQKERIIDVSGQAARELDLVRMGVAKVTIEVVE